MDDLLRPAFQSIPPLHPGARYAIRHSCKLCGGGAAPFDRVDFNKHCDRSNPYKFGYANVMIDYLRCEQCGFTFTEFFDSWTAEDWSQFVYNNDYIKVDSEYAAVRPMHAARHFSSLLRGAENARILDFGAGAGIFVERMREFGFTNITGYDPFSSPTRPEGLFDIITCFEVIEHSPDPLATVGDMASLLAVDGCILFSQTVQPDDILSQRGNWWYLAPRNGHVSTYADETLALLGHRLGLHFHRGDTVYGYANRSPSPAAQKVLALVGPRFGIARLYAPTGLPDAPIAFPSNQQVWWHQAECSATHRFRWTGASRVSWNVKWSDVTMLQIRLPFVAEIEPDFAAQCSLRLNGRISETWLSRGDLVAEFNVEDAGEGVVELRTPPLGGDPDSARRLGLAIPLGPEPLWAES